MKNDATFRKNPLYLGVDIGGTKVQASLVRESGGILQRERQPTPRTGGPEQVLAVVEKVMEDVLNKGKVAAGDLTAVWVPDASHEALRDLVRAREAAKKDQLRARHRLGNGKLVQVTGVVIVNGSPQELPEVTDLTTVHCR